MASHHIQGRTVAMPVEIRDATACAATYLVRADAVRAVLAYCDLDVAEVLPGKALCTLAFIRYDEGDLGSYNEFGVAFSVRPPDDRRRRTRGPVSGLRDVLAAVSGMFVHWLPVDQRFTMEAGRAIWGFPKELAQIDLRLSSPYKRCLLRKDDRLVLDLLIRPGVPVVAARTPMDAYSHLDGVTRRTRWHIRPHALRTRPGGALVRLGNHPIAKELSELGLPKRALATVTVSGAALSFEEPRSMPCHRR
ncbi:acetoacetate decarboxylase family protein [Sphaerisporangium sp. TRM90804]|uniref:acetoacetate decarboxylase family protein n=1 Tax=Sphaerisporangium sp. TRM90804 TaxID=3031113 RepID=UPI00244B7282|nr:acetoacetate decarboxylase family protein [Sphaerisporangium sp. TRM90804]MDH2427812.1 acetoacetate decarboxylase family protein [Sphaerisporangium sp. TRM90804]